MPLGKSLVTENVKLQEKSITLNDEKCKLILNLLKTFVLKKVLVFWRLVMKIIKRLMFLSQRTKW